MLNMPAINLLCRCIICYVTVAVTAAAQQNEQLFEQTTTKAFTEVIEDAEFVITEHNFNIIKRLHISRAIQERGNHSFPKNEIILFCNLSLAETMLTAAPGYIYYCPYKVRITETEGKVTVGTILLPTNTGTVKLDEVAKTTNKILKAIVDYAAALEPFIFE